MSSTESFPAVSPDPGAPSSALDDEGFVVELEQFQGPLDLLLHLIRSQDIDIFDIPIARITSQFLAAVSGVEALGLDRAGEFLEMAATLIRIKAQMLLPRHGGEFDGMEDPRAELVRRLLEYEHFRDIARRLEDAEGDRGRHYRKGYVPPRPEPAPSPDPVPLDVAWEDLWAAALSLADRAWPLDQHRVARRLVSVDEKIALIVKTLAEERMVAFRRLVAPFHDPLHAVVTLLASLELSRRQEVALRQREPFADLWVHRRQETR